MSSIRYNAVLFPLLMIMACQITLAAPVIPKLSVITENGASLQIDSFNASHLSGKISCFDSSYSSTTLTMPPVIEAVITDGVVKELLTSGNALIPPGGFVLSGDGKTSAWFTENLQPGRKVSIGLSPSTSKQAELVRKVDGINVECKDNSVVVYNKIGTKRSKVTGPNGIEVLIENGYVTAIGTISKDIPVNGMIITSRGTGSKWIESNLAQGMKVSISNGAIVASSDAFTYITAAKGELISADDRINQGKHSLYQLPLTAYSDTRNKASDLINQSLVDLTAGNSSNAAVKAVTAIEMLRSAEIFRVPSRSVELRGVWHRPVEKTEAEIITTLDRLSESNVNALFLETFYTGKAIYASSFVEQYDDTKAFDYLGTWVKEAHKRGIEVHTWIHTLRFVAKGPILQTHNGWSPVQLIQTPNQGTGLTLAADPGVDFADPSNPDVQEFVVNLVKELAAKYDIDGIQLDYIRYASINPPAGGYEYSEVSRSSFMKLYGMDPNDITPKNTALWQAWCNWRQEQVTNVVRRIRRELLKVKPDLLLSADVVSSVAESKSRLQDWNRWIDEGLIDFICPMLYHTSSQWVEAAAKNSMDITGIKSFLVGGVGPFIGLNDISLANQVVSVRTAGGQGVALFALHSLGTGQLLALKAGPFRDKAIIPYRTDRSIPTALSALAGEIRGAYVREGLLTKDDAEIIAAKLEAWLPDGQGYGSLLSLLAGIENGKSSVQPLRNRLEEITQLIIIARRQSTVRAASLQP